MMIIEVFSFQDDTMNDNDNSIIHKIIQKILIAFVCFYNFLIVNPSAIVLNKKVAQYKTFM